MAYFLPYSPRPMKRLVVSSLTAICGLILTTTAHASFVERNFQAQPEWKTQEEVDAEAAMELDARTEVPSTQREAIDEEQSDFNETDSNREPEFGEQVVEQDVRDIRIGSSTNVTRAEFTALLVRAEYPKASIDSCYWDITSVWPPRFELLFRDVPVEHAYAPEICVAMREGLVRGYGNDIFRPDQTITFADAAKILSRAHGLTPWADAGKPKHWFDPYVHALSDRNAIPLSVQKIEEKITGDEAREMVDRLAFGDRTKPSRSAEQLIAAWEKTYETRPPVTTIRVPQKPAMPTVSSAAKSSASSASSVKPVTSPIQTKSSAAPIIPTNDAASSRQKAWYEF